jgi:hypothetical protein
MSHELALRKCVIIPLTSGGFQLLLNIFIYLSVLQTFHLTALLCMRVRKLVLAYFICFFILEILHIHFFHFRNITYSLFTMFTILLIKWLPQQKVFFVVLSGYYIMFYKAVISAKDRGRASRVMKQLNILHVKRLLHMLSRRQRQSSGCP